VFDEGVGDVVGYLFLDLWVVSKDVE